MKFFRFARRLTDRLESYHVSLYAANASFYIVLSVFPAMVLLLSLVPYLGYSQEELIFAVHGVLPGVLQPFFDYIVEDLAASGSTAVLSISAIAAVWSSSRGVYCIQLGLNAISGKRSKQYYLVQRLLCMFYMVLFIAALLLTLILRMFGRQIAEYCALSEIPLLRFFAQLLRFRALLLMLLLTFFFTILYLAFCNRKQKLRFVVPGAFSATIGWFVFSELFSIYVKYFGDFSRFYGSLSALAMSMLWLYACVSILFYGQVFNLYLSSPKNWLKNA